MRLSEWRKTAPSKDALSNRVLAVLRPLLVDLGAESDAECWVAWGDDPEYKYSILAPALAGLINIAVRLGAPEEGARATARLIRWSKVSVTELGIEASGGHRMVAVQVESHVLKGIDDEADRICEFVRGLIASVEDRNPQAIPIAVVQGVAAGRGVAALAALPVDAADAATAEGTGPVSGSGPAAPKRAGSAAAKSAPRAPKAAPKPAVKPAASAETPSAAEAVPGTLVPFPAPTPDAAPGPPKPPAARTAAAQHGDKPGASHPAPGQPEPEAEQPAWVGPHPIEESPVRDPNKPRPWKP